MRREVFLLFLVVLGFSSGSKMVSAEAVIVTGDFYEHFWSAYLPNIFGIPAPSSALELEGDALLVNPREVNSKVRIDAVSWFCNVWTYGVSFGMTIFGIEVEAGVSGTLKTLEFDIYHNDELKDYRVFSGSMGAWNSIEWSGILTPGDSSSHSVRETVSIEGAHQIDVVIIPIYSQGFSDFLEVFVYAYLTLIIDDDIQPPDVTP